MDEGTDSREAGDEARVPSGSAEGLLQGESAGSVKEWEEGKRTSHAQTRLARRLLERAVRSMRAAPAAMAALGRARVRGCRVAGGGLGGGGGGGWLGVGCAAHGGWWWLDERSGGGCRGCQERSQRPQALRTSSDAMGEEEVGGDAAASWFYTRRGGGPRLPRGTGLDGRRVRRADRWMTRFRCRHAMRG